MAEVAGAPEHWSATENVVWRAEIEGYGISSPVVLGNRVYVTTAMTGKHRAPFRLVCDALIGVLAVLGVPLLVAYRWRLRTTKAANDHRTLLSRAAEPLDLAIFLAVAIGVLVFGTLMAIGPEAVDVALNSSRDLGVTIARLLGRHHTNLWFFHWDEGTPHNTWIISSGMALLSMGLVPFLYPTSSKARGAGAVALLLGVGLAKVFVPWGIAYGGRFPTGVFVVFYSPVVVLAAWHLAFLVSRAGRVERAGATKGSRLAGCVPALLALALFVSPNYLAQREMVTRRVISLDATTGKKVWQTRHAWKRRLRDE